MREPEVVDLELTTDTLKASVRDAQRTVAELRTDLEARRRELAEAQVARAQLEGRVREAERRVIEARLVIELATGRTGRSSDGAAACVPKQSSIAGPDEAAPEAALKNGEIGPEGDAGSRSTKSALRISGAASDGGDPGCCEAGAGQP